MVAPRVGAGLDRQEPIGAVRPGQAAAGAGEVGVERGRVLVALVAVAPSGIGLPDLDQLTGHRPAAFVDDASGHRDALPDRLARMPGRQVGVERVDVLVAEARRPELDPLGIDRDQGCLGWRSVVLRYGG